MTEAQPSMSLVPALEVAGLAKSFGSLTVVLIAVYGFLSGRPDFLDLALVYALISFISTIPVSKYVEFSHMGRPTGGDERGDI